MKEVACYFCDIVLLLIALSPIFCLFKLVVDAYMEMNEEQKS